MQKIATFIKEGLYKTSIRTMSNYAGKYRDAEHSICKKKKKKLQKMIKDANVNIVTIGYVNMLKYEEEYVTLLTDMQKLIINI